MYPCFRFRAWRLILLAAVLACSLVVGGEQSGRAQGVAPGHVLVRIQPGVEIQKLAQDYHASVVEQVPGTLLYSLALPGGTTEAGFAATLNADARVVYSQPDLLITSPEVYGEPFHFAFDLSTKPTIYANSVAYTQVHLGALDALAQTNANGVLASGTGIVVAVLDTGAAFSHPALIGHFLPGYNAIYPGLPPDDEPDGATNNETGHGTMVAGIIARLAPQAQIMPVRVLNGDGAGTMLNLVKGIHYAIAHGARIINMSFSCSVSSGALNDALDSAELTGVVLIASAGNDNARVPRAPAVGRGTLAVAAVEADNTKSPYSNYGSFIDVVAPGSGIRSTFWDGGYATWSGTSFAAPFVAAEAALILSNQPGLTSDEAVSAIGKTAHSLDRNNPAYKGQLGRGIIDIEAGVKAAGH
jgi:subtilisin family serine protease